VLHPISVARLVMERTKHVLLVGEGALRFARAMGIEEQDLLTPKAREAWDKWRAGEGQQLEPWEQAMLHAKSGRPGTDHDTIGMIALDNGRLATAVTTSGLAFKVPGRVGDSPIVGAGSYCDDDVGAAVSTGVGEEVIRTGGCVSIVESMRRGLTPRRAVAEVLARIRRSMAAGGRTGQVAFLVLSRGGEVFGGALQPGFQYAFTDGGGSRLVDGEVVP
jgi:N4-(beta-N-acetylglucosaminyl)-L-asparaginase